MEKEIFEKVTEILCEHLGLSPEEVTLEAELNGDLGADSLDQVELSMRFEEEYDIEIPDEDSEKLVTVKDLVDYIEKSI